jgi:hypothetical protein
MLALLKVIEDTVGEPACAMTSKGWVRIAMMHNAFPNDERMRLIFPEVISRTCCPRQ